MFKIVYRYIISNKKSSIGAIIGIAISTMLMFSMIQISDCYLSSFKSFVNSNAPQDFYVIDLSYEELTEIDEKFRNMGEKAPDRYLSTMLIGQIFEDNSKSSIIMGFEGDLDYFKKTSLLSGKYPESENEICIEESYAKLHPELNINGSLALDITLIIEDYKDIDINKEFKICGIIKDVMDNGNFFFTNLKTAQDILTESNMNDSMSNAVIVEAEEGNFNDEKIVYAKEEIENIVADDSPESIKYFNSMQIIDNDEKMLNYSEKGSFESVSLTIFLLSLIIAVCLTIFVYNTVSLSFVRKINVFGTMRCIGLTNKQLIGFILTEQFLLVSMGTFIGMASGALLNLTIAEKIMSILISTVANMKVEQNIKTYIITYLITLISAFSACLKLIFKIRKTNPINIRAFDTNRKLISEKSKKLNSRNYLFNLALRNLKRNFAKSMIQTITLIVSFMLCLVICNFFSVIKVNSISSAVDFSDYSIQADIVDIVYDSAFTEDDLEILKSADRIDAVYTEECLQDYNWNKACEPLQILLYDDNLWQKFADINNIDYNSEKPFSILISEPDNNIKIQSLASNKEYTISPDVNLKDAIDLNYAIYNNKNKLIINKRMAENLDYTTGNYCAFLVETNEDLSELSDIDFSTNKVYITNLHSGKEDAEAQLLGMIIISIYIVTATVLLSFMIISNTIKENMANKKSEYGVMRAMGLSLKNLWTVVCYENFILTVISCAISIPVSLIINSYLTFILFDEIRISAFAYLLVNLLFICLIELFAYFNIRNNTNDSIVEMIYEMQ